MPEGLDQLFFAFGRGPALGQEDAQARDHCVVFVDGHRQPHNVPVGQGHGEHLLPDLGQHPLQVLAGLHLFPEVRVGHAVDLHKPVPLRLRQKSDQDPARGGFVGVAVGLAPHLQVLVAAHRVHDKPFVIAQYTQQRRLIDFRRQRFHHVFGHQQQVLVVGHVAGQVVGHRPQPVAFLAAQMLQVILADQGLDDVGAGSLMKVQGGGNFGQGGGLFFVCGYVF